MPLGLPARPCAEAGRTSVGAQAGEPRPPALRRPEHDLNILGVQGNRDLDDLPLEELDQIFHVHLSTEQPRLVKEKVLGRSDNVTRAGLEVDQQLKPRCPRMWSTFTPLNPPQRFQVGRYGGDPRGARRLGHSADGTTNSAYESALAKVRHVRPGDFVEAPGTSGALQQAPQHFCTPRPGGRKDGQHNPLYTNHQLCVLP